MLVVASLKFQTGEKEMPTVAGMTIEGFSREFTMGRQFIQDLPNIHQFLIKAS
jgi:hypothetical protein